MSPAPRKKYISTTNHDGGAAHIGHPSSCTQLPITTDALITLYTPPILHTIERYQSPRARDANTNHHGGAPKTHSLDTLRPLHTFLLSFATVAPITLLCTSPILYQSTRAQTLLLPLLSTPRTLYIHQYTSYARSTAFIYLSRFV